MSWSDAASDLQASFVLQLNSPLGLCSLALVFCLSKGHGGPVWALGIGQGGGFGSPDIDTDLVCLWCADCLGVNDGCSHTAQKQIGSEPPLCPTVNSLLGHSIPHASVELCHEISEAGASSQLRLGCTLGQSFKTEQTADHQPSLPLLRNRQACISSSGVECRLPTVLLLVPLDL